MKLLYICGTYAPGANGGSEISAHEMVRQVARLHSVEILVVTDKSYTGGQPRDGSYEGVPIRGVDHDSRESAIAATIDSFRPDVILTQLLWADVALRIGRGRNIPVILRLVSIPTNIDLMGPAAIIVNSRFSKDWVARTVGRDSDIVLSSINFEKSVARDDERAPHWIAMFNPVKHKGGDVFRRIAQAMPNRQFAVVPGWHALRAKDGTWDRALLRRSLESQGATSMDWAPEDVDFGDLPNVTTLAPRERVAEIFAQIRVLLVPSQWEETFGRVTIEAFGNGIPVVGSDIGGLKEYVGAAGMLVGDYADPAAWIKAIEKLDDPQIYADYARREIDFVRQSYSIERIAAEFYSILLRVISKQ